MSESQKQINTNHMLDTNMQARARAERLRKHRFLFATTLVAIVVYITWRIFFTLPHNYGWVALILGVLLLVAEVGAAFEAAVNYSMLSKYEPPEMPDIPEDWYPEIDICIATHNEPVEMLYSTVNACLFMDYPDKSKVHVHLCDDTARPEMEEMARELGINYWGLANNKNAKGGNLNNAIRQTYAPIVITLDADMIPRHEFLMHTVPYFFVPKMKKDEEGNWVPKSPEEIDPNERIGFVQTPQGFYNPDLFQYNLRSETRIPGEQDLFFREINVARSAYNASLYVGSNTLISRQALEDVDYIAIDTITEDILTGMRIQKLGYTTYATSELLVQGQAPVTIKGLLNQRERWGRGCIDAMRQEPIIFSTQLSFSQKVSYATCWIFWWAYARRAVFLLVPIASILFNLHVVQAEFIYALVFWLPYYLLLNRSLRVMSGDVWNQHWSSVADTVLFPYMIGPILAEQLGFKQKKFQITEKKVSGTFARATFVFGVPHLVFLIGMIVSLIVVITKSIATGSIYNPIILFWLISGSKNLLFALFFMWGRDNYRLASRFYFEEPIIVATSYHAWNAKTSDVSETGLAFYLSNPNYIPENAPLLVRLDYRGHNIFLHGTVVHVVQAGDRWKYSIHFDEITGEEKRYYREYVYDRPHSLPAKLDPSSSILDDFNLQLGKRMQSTQDSMRKLPRVHLDIPFLADGEEKGTLVDFNYRYANVRFDNPALEVEKIYVDVAPELELLLTRVETEDKKGLYQVEDSDRFITSEVVVPVLSELTAKSPKAKAAMQVKAHVISGSYREIDEDSPEQKAVNS